MSYYETLEETSEKNNENDILYSETPIVNDTPKDENVPETIYSPASEAKTIVADNVPTPEAGNETETINLHLSTGWGKFQDLNDETDVINPADNRQPVAPNANEQTPPVINLIGEESNSGETDTDSALKLEKTPGAINTHEIPVTTSDSSALNNKIPPMLDYQNAAFRSDPDWTFGMNPYMGVNSWNWCPPPSAHTWYWNSHTGNWNDKFNNILDSRTGLPVVNPAQNNAAPATGAPVVNPAQNEKDPTAGAPVVNPAQNEKDPTAGAQHKRKLEDESTDEFENSKTDADKGATSANSVTPPKDDESLITIEGQNSTPELQAAHDKVAETEEKLRAVLARLTKNHLKLKEQLEHDIEEEKKFLKQGIDALDDREDKVTLKDGSQGLKDHQAKEFARYTELLKELKTDKDRKEVLDAIQNWQSAQLHVLKTTLDEESDKSSEEAFKALQEMMGDDSLTATETSDAPGSKPTKLTFVDLMESKQGTWVSENNKTTIHKHGNKITSNNATALALAVKAAKFKSIEISGRNPQEVLDLAFQAYHSGIKNIKFSETAKQMFSNPENAAYLGDGSFLGGLFGGGGFSAFTKAKERYDLFNSLLETSQVARASKINHAFNEDQKLSDTAITFLGISPLTNGRREYVRALGPERQGKLAQELANNIFKVDGTAYKGADYIRLLIAGQTNAANQKNFETEYAKEVAKGLREEIKAKKHTVDDVAAFIYGQSGNYVKEELISAANIQKLELSDTLLTKDPESKGGADVAKQAIRAQLLAHILVDYKESTTSLRSKIANSLPANSLLGKAKKKREDEIKALTWSLTAEEKETMLQIFEEKWMNRLDENSKQRVVELMKETQEQLNSEKSSASKFKSPAPEPKFKEEEEEENDEETENESDDEKSDDEKSQNEKTENESDDKKSDDEKSQNEKTENESDDKKSDDEKTDDEKSQNEKTENDEETENEETDDENDYEAATRSRANSI